MDLRYTKNLTKESADIYIYDEIGYGVNAGGFVRELNWLIEDSGVSLVNVRINSPGGSVFDGLGIFAAITNSKVPVHTYIDGVAASAAGFIAMAGKKRYMVSHGQLMMHNVSAGYSDDPTEQAKIDTAVDALEDSIATILSNNSGLSKEDVRAKMNKETWLNSSTALELKFIDGIYDKTPTKRMEKNELMAFVNSIQKPNNKKMINVLKALNLNEDASEEKAVSEVETLKTKVEALETEKTALETEVNTLKAEKTANDEAALDAVVEAEVTEAINKGKFPIEKKEELKATAKKDIEGFKNLVGSIVVATAPDLTKAINKADNSKHEGKTFRELEKTKEGIAYLTNLASENPEEYRNFYNQSYKK